MPSLQSQDWRCSSQSPSSSCWKEGEIAFLKSWEIFSPSDHSSLINSRAVEKHATQHPVIVLKVLDSGRFVVIPVSAYSSGAFNDYLPPWEQYNHVKKLPVDFRSFEGTQPYNKTYPELRLTGGDSMPKPRASWLYIQSVFEVPDTVLGIFNKARTTLRLEQQSLDSLRQHIVEGCKRYKSSWAFQIHHQADSCPASTTAPSTAPAPAPKTTAAIPWRQIVSGSCSSQMTSSPPTPAETEARMTDHGSCRQVRGGATRRQQRAAAAAAAKQSLPMIPTPVQVGAAAVDTRSAPPPMTVTTRSWCDVAGSPPSNIPPCISSATRFKAKMTRRRTVAAVPGRA